MQIYHQQCFILKNIIFILIVIFPEIALAAGDKSITMESLLFNFGPIILLVALWIIFMKRSGIGAKKQKDYIDRLHVHMARNEELLERIAKAVEKDN